MATILCVDDEPGAGLVLETQLGDLGHRPVLARSFAEATEVIARETVDLILCNFRIAESSGIDLIRMLRERESDIPVIIMTEYSSVEDAVDSMRHGATDYLTKPLRVETLRLAVQNALEVERLRRENDAIRLELSSIRGGHAIVGDSPALSQVMDLIAQVAPTNATVLLEGESGTGKELFARAIHEQSPRRDQPFVTVNCAALPEGLIESTLFGHERGAFTGASSRAHGAFERADRGTLLLDEISEMRIDLQAKLLRAIQEHEFERVGGQEAVRVDVRIVATTNRDLRAEVEAGRFRKDLYFRLNVFPIRTPPLREHREDIEPLARHFVEHYVSALGVRNLQLPKHTIEVLKRRDWKGNVRELANAIERGVILARGDQLEPGLFEVSASGPPGADPEHTAVATSLGEESDAEEGTSSSADSESRDPINLHDLEEVAIERALRATGGRRAKAAALLGISERTLRNKLNNPR